MIEIELNEETISKLLYIDGSLRDIYVHNTDINDWNKLYQSLLNSEYQLSYLRDGELQEIPENAELILCNNKCAHTFRVQSENIVFITHFFIEQQIEFDVDPKDFNSYDQSEILFDFMHFVSDVLGKEVVMSPENSEEIALLKTLPNDDRIYKLE